MLKVSHATALINNTQTNKQPRNINNTKKEEEKKSQKQDLQPSIACKFIEARSHVIKKQALQ